MKRSRFDVPPSSLINGDASASLARTLSHDAKRKRCEADCEQKRPACEQQDITNEQTTLWIGKQIMLGCWF